MITWQTSEDGKSGYYTDTAGNFISVMLSAIPSTDTILPYTPTLAEVQATQLALMDSAYITANQLPIAYMSTTFQADANSQILLNQVLTACGGTLPTGFQWYDANNVGVTMTYAQLAGLAGALLVRGQPLFVNKQTKKAAIRAATTVAEVQAIAF
jgi:hypothetical protein